MLSPEEFKRKFLVNEDGAVGTGAIGGGIANTTANVQGLETIPVVSKKRQRKLIRRNAAGTPKA